MQIVTECLIGWNTKTQTGRVGVLGKPLAWSRTDEEQARKTLHAHWQIWIEYFNDCREALFSHDEEERKKARDTFIQYVDSVISASYPDYTVAHVCEVGNGKETTPILRTQPVSDLFKECEDKNVLRKARHKDHCLIINGKFLNCKECRKAFSPRQCMEMAIANWRRNATHPQMKEGEEELQQGMKGENNDYDQDEEETHTASKKKYTRRENMEQKVWLDRITIRHPYDFDEEGMPSEALKAEIPDDGPNNADIAWLKEMQARSTLLHYRFDEHDEWHRTTCFKNDCECRAKLPMMASDTTFIHDNDTLPDTLNQMQQPTTNNNLDNEEQQQQNDSTSRSNAGDREDAHDEQEDHLTSKQIRNVRWNYLDGTTKLKSQYAVIPKRGIGSQFLNAHNIAMSNILGCNTNVTIGDASHTYYCTLYKSKDTQAEDKEALLRVHGSFGRRILRRKILLQQQQQQAAEEREQQRKSQPEQKQDGNEQVQVSESDCDDADDKDECHAEGLGRVMTGVNSLLSRNVVSPTMAHLLISQGGTRFTYSHGEENLLVTQLEDYLEGRECNFILRKNYNKIEKRVERWPDSTAYDYVFRPRELQQLCYYEYMMKYKKGFKTFKRINREQDLEISGNADCNDEESSVRLEFQDGHPGKRYAFLTKRKFPVIPTIMMRNGRLCDVELLEIWNTSPSFNTARYRENYAKQALMMFFPITVVDDLNSNGSHWEKFIAVGGTKCYDAKLDCQDETPAGCMWEYGKRILENIQTRKTVKSKMKRPPDPLALGTKRPQSTGERMKADIDDEVRFDADFSEYCIDDDNDTHNGILEPLAQNAKRSHKTLIDRANVNATKLVQPIVAPGETLINTSDNAGDTSSTTENTTTATSSTQRNPLASYSPTTRYGQMLTFIRGTLVGGRNQQESTNTNRPWWDTDGDDPTLTMTDDEIEANFDRLWDEAVAHAASSKEKNTTNSIPTLQQVANESGRYLDDKQYVAYQIISCTFLIQLINEGGDTNSRLGGILGATLGLSDEDLAVRNDLKRELEDRGGLDQLLMLLTGGAGCGKSTSLDAAQEFAHKFCMAVAVAFNDYTFYFTSTTGSSAALFGGSTIHGAAHLNKSRLDDNMRQIWREDVKILIIDEISFFKTSDMQKLDQQLRKLTGRSKIFGGISIVFSGDFHQLKPICSEGEVLYSGSASATSWEQALNCAIFLNNSHRFKDDPEYGRILERMRMGETTLADREEINMRVINPKNGIVPPSDEPNISYACGTNKQRNGVIAGHFQQHILSTHPDVDSDEDPPGHTLMIEASFTSSKEASTGENKGGKSKKRKRNSKNGKKRKISQALHDIITTELGDNDIKSTDFKTKGAKLDPVLRLYHGSHHMCITNDDLSKGRGNGTLCKCIKVKLKKGKRRRWKNWEGKKVWTASIDDVAWVEFEHFPEPPKGKAKRFRLTPQKFTATITFNIVKGLTTESNFKVGNATVTQIPVNSNVATTGHKLQGMSKDTLIVSEWDYRCANWVYVVLSRVRTRKGLFLTKPLDLDRVFNVPESLIDFENRIRTNLEQPTLDTLTQKGYYRPGPEGTHNAE